MYMYMYMYAEVGGVLPSGWWVETRYVSVLLAQGGLGFVKQWEGEGQVLGGGEFLILQIFVVMRHTCLACSSVYLHFSASGQRQVIN